MKSFNLIHSIYGLTKTKVINTLDCTKCILVSRVTLGHTFFGKEIEYLSADMVELTFEQHGRIDSSTLYNIESNEGYDLMMGKQGETIKYYNYGRTFTIVSSDFESEIKQAIKMFNDLTKLPLEKYEYPVSFRLPPDVLLPRRVKL